MKKVGFWFILVYSSVLLVNGQTVDQNIGYVEYENLKDRSELKPGINYIIDPSTLPPRHAHAVPNGDNSRAGGCACYIEPDASYILAMGPNDDGSTANIPIPFNFCLYGTNYTSLWINNNGNVTFDGPYGTFSAVGFPSPSYVMTAPFWGDVDTRNGYGQVWYKITSSAVYVNWDSVGYYNIHGDLRNTFQLIITDGNDPIIGAGNNVAFCYQNMDWTTGDASGGSGGFGGIPATVGCNKGDGIDYVQFGRFDQPGSAYDGPFGANDGVDWLDNQSFIFNACNTTNISPTIAGGISLCDTIDYCLGTNLTDTINILSPELGQFTTINASSGSPDFTIVSITNGNTAQLVYTINATTPGVFNVTITAFDDGVPPDTVTFNLSFNISPNTTPQPVISGDTVICPGENTVLTASGGTYDYYTWSTGSTVNTTTVNAGGTYLVTVGLNGCEKQDSIQVFAYPTPTPALMGDTTICGGDSSLLTLTNGPFTQYTWSNGDTTATTYVSAAGTYTVTVVDSNTCTGSNTIDVVTVNPVININASPTSICGGDSILMTATPFLTFTSIVWSDGAVGPLDYATTSGQYIVTGTEPGGCQASDTITISLYPDPLGNIVAPATCSNEAAPFNFNNTGPPISNYHWDFGNGAVTNDTSNIAAPNYQYPGPGNYPVVLILETSDGCTDTLATIVNIQPLPSGTITNIAVCEDHDEVFNFNQTSSDSLTYVWNFPGGTPGTSTAINPTVNFANNGTYNTSVIITNQYGCFDTIVQPFLVRAHPTAGIGAYPICISRFTFDPLVAPDDNTVTIDWDLGDGFVINGTDTSIFNHIYVGPGDYNATLVITDQYGCKDSITQVVHVDDSLFFDMPNVLVQTSNIDNDKVDMEEKLPGFNLCINWTYTVYDRWGVQVFETTNDPYNPDLNCDHCFRGKAQGGQVLVPGVYYYIMKGNFSILKAGFITIFE